jgi:hypothetical protein
MTCRQVVGVLILASPLVAITVYAILQGKLRDVLFFWGTAVVVAPIVMAGMHFLFTPTKPRRLH